MNGTSLFSPLPVIFLIQPQGGQCAGTAIWLNA